MMIFMKIKEDGNVYDKTNMILETDAVSLGDILYDFSCFLRGAGYSLPESDNPIIVNDEDNE